MDHERGQNEQIIAGIEKIETMSDNSLPDIANMNIKSRINKKTQDFSEEPLTNGLHNGICNSQKNISVDHNLLPGTQSMETSHLNKLDKEEVACVDSKDNDIEYVSYTNELQMPDIMKLIQKDLSEPYSIYTYRYFIHNWPKLCFLAMHGKECVGAIVCKLDIHRKVIKRGYIAMLAVDIKYRKRKIGSNLVRKAIRAMVEDDADEVVLETEITNRSALRLYENLGFVRDKRLFRYYLNGVDALRLKLWLR
ncbi:GSCOCG00006333001-RA-CDS [Cotesia congregata]|uniref:N-terminal methionine N(alpha)-acetyltransferase NatC n=1 Tax=Cotesia congregata TaxID=51543 RepID=A0A8J2HLI3_COTCN|nr:GSCOCG00006333001-RA-CDS [Cotesia congregata]CAG5096356.1 Similar to NAA30: N-alpha-acetyltransferase 30 (Homo sapiens) [Cotesia congregata]